MSKLQKLPKIISATLGLLTVIISLTCIIAFKLSDNTRPPLISEKVEDILAKDIEGWTVQDLPMDTSAEVAMSIANQLKFTEAVFRTYQKGDITIAVYIGYWRSGTMSVNQVALHTPDTCWVFSGWEKVSRQHSLNIELLESKLLPVEQGEYTKDNIYQDVMFWHLVNGSPYSYFNPGDNSNLIGKFQRLVMLPIKSFLKFGWQEPGDQFFIRISSNKKIESLYNNAGFLKIIESIKPLGVFADATQDKSSTK